MKRIEITYSKPFFEEKFNDYIVKKYPTDIYIQDIIKKSPFAYKFACDFDIIFIDETLSIFLEKMKHDLRSQNKPSFMTENNKRKEFFSNNKLYHHHLIDKNQYAIPNIGQKIIQIEPKRTISDLINANCHTSNLYIHYKKEETNDLIEYNLFLITLHPRGEVQWNQFVQELSLIID